MNIRKEKKRNRKKIFAAVILALMTVLAVGAAVFAEGGDSYALTIVKKINKSDLPDDVLNWANNQEYTFRVDGFGIEHGNVKSFREIFKDETSMPEGVRFVDGNDNALLVTIKGEGSRDIHFNTAVAATVSEVTNALQYKDDTDVWSMSTVDCEANMPTKLVYGTNAGTGSRDLTINIGKDGGAITISKPQEAQWVGYFRPRKKTEPSAASYFQQSRLSEDDLPVKPIRPGESVSWEGLTQGSYVIEKMEGAKGFSVHVGQRQVDVPEGGEGTVYINGNYGNLTITAPGVRGSNEQYYYVIRGTTKVIDENGKEREEPYERATSPVKAGEPYKVEHLPRGLFTVKEYNYSPTQGFTVTGKKVSSRVKTLTSKVNAQKLNTWRWVDSLPEDMLSNAQVEISQIKGLSKGQSVKFGIGGTWSDDPKEKLWNYACTVGTPRKIDTRYMLPGSRILLNWNGNAKITEVVVKFYYDREIDDETVCKKSDVFYTKTISQDWMEISKAADNTPEGEIYYYYTILDKDNNPITNYSVIKNGTPVSGSDVTDKEGTAVRIKSGDAVRIEGLEPGSYQIMETIDADEPAAFQMAVEETESTTSPSESVGIEILGPRTITIKRDENLSEENFPELVYVFQVKVKDGETLKEVMLKEGESAEIELPSAGKYTVEELDRNELFVLNYTDSGTVGVMTTTKAWNSRSFFRRTEEEPAQSTVTFTNSFSRKKGAYQVIHEYYYEKDGVYTCEGTSILTSVGGLSLNDKQYTADADVTKQHIFDGTTYTYLQSAYGTSEEIVPEELTLSDEPMQFCIATGSNITTRSRTNHENMRAYRTKIDSIASSSTAEKSLPEDEETELTASTASRSVPAKKRSSEKDIMSLTNNKGVDIKLTEYNNKGIISRGILHSAGKDLAYEPADEKSYVHATPEGNQVIILRYVRKDTLPEGNYKILHVYYLRGENGDIREGTSEIIDTVPIKLTNETRKELHKVESVPPITTPSVYYNQAGFPIKNKYNYTYDSYAYGEVVDGGTPDNEFYIFGQTYRADSREGVQATEAGNQIIILRYVREKKDTTNRSGSYKVVHEYYYREAADSGQINKDEEDNNPNDETKSPRSRFMDIPNENPTDYSAYDLSKEEAMFAVQPADIPEETDSEEKFNGTLTGDSRYSYTFEGMTEVEDISAPLGSTVSADTISWKPEYKPDGKMLYIYRYKDGVYGETLDNGYYEWIPDKTLAASTEEGNQIIILRYIRWDDNPNVSYNYVHEYYLKHPDGSLTLEGKSDIGTVPNADADKEYTGEDVSRIPDYKGTTYTYYECGYGNVSDDSYKEDEGKKFVKATESGDQIIILRYYREESTKDPDPSPKVSYKYIHEYYLKHPDGSLTLEGKSDIGTVPDAKAGVEYNDKNVTQVPDYEGKTYTYFNCGYGAMFSDKDYSELPDKTFIYATESGEQIIILRYEREEKPDDPKPSGGGGRKHSDPDPKPTPAPTTVPEPVPEVPTVPVVESVPETSPVPEPDAPVLPDPNLPGSPERITIMDGGVPKTYIKVWNPTTEEYVYLEEDDVPLTGLNDPSLPRTNDNTNFFLWISLVSASLGGIIIIGYRRFRKEH